jgi:hypothetical protein
VIPYDDMEVSFCEKFGDVEAHASVDTPLAVSAVRIVACDTSCLEEDPADERGGEAADEEELKEWFAGYAKGEVGDRDLLKEVEAAFVALRRSLAYLGVRGKLVLDPDPTTMSGENLDGDGPLKKALTDATRAFVGELSEQDLRVTDEDVRAIREEVAEEEARFFEGAKTLARVMKEEALRRGLDKEGREGFTIGDLR